MIACCFVEMDKMLCSSMIHHAAGGQQEGRPELFQEKEFREASISSQNCDIPGYIMEIRGNRKFSKTVLGRAEAPTNQSQLDHN